MIIIVCLILFIIWTLLMLKNKLDNVDNRVYNKIKFNNFLIEFNKIITNFASTKFFIFICFIFLLFLKEKKIVYLFIGIMLGCSLVVGFFKNIIKRERPDINRLVYEKGYSYPSGHTVSAISFYGFILFLALISNIVLPFKIILSFILILLILLIGFSRIFLGVHYFSDIIGAIILGFSYLLSYIYIVNHILNFI